MRNATELDNRIDPFRSNVRMASRNVCFSLPSKPKSSGTTSTATTRHTTISGTCTPNSHRHPR